MRNKKYLILLTLILQIGGGKFLNASPADLPDLSTPSAPKYYVIMNASKALDNGENNEYRYLRYQGWNRNRPNCLSRCTETRHNRHFCKATSRNRHNFRRQFVTTC